MAAYKDDVMVTDYTQCNRKCCGLQHDVTFTHPEDLHSIEVRDSIRGLNLAAPNIVKDPPEFAVLGHVEGLLGRVHDVFGLGVYGNKILQGDASGGRERGRLI